MKTMTLQQQTSRARDGTEAASNLANTVAKSAKEIRELFTDVPYVKGLAGLIVQIITVTEVRCYRWLE
jgi:hypothetical protein